MANWQGGKEKCPDPATMVGVMLLEILNILYLVGHTSCNVACMRAPAVYSCIDVD